MGCTYDLDDVESPRKFPISVLDLLNSLVDNVPYIFVKPGPELESVLTSMLAHIARKTTNNHNVAAPLLGPFQCVLATGTLAGVSTETEILVGRLLGIAETDIFKEVPQALLSTEPARTTSKPLANAFRGLAYSFRPDVKQFLDINAGELVQHPLHLGTLDYLSVAGTGTRLRKGCKDIWVFYAW